MMGLSANFIKIITIIIIVAVNFQSLESTPLSLATDKEALISFKPQVSWDENLSPCNWSGVSCDHQAQRVVSLDLSNLGITGPISPHIGNLSFLTTLNLQDNHLVGQIPHHLTNLLRLTTLNLSFNRISGPIPTNISRCKYLTTFDLTGNSISGTIPPELSLLTNLRVNLASNRLSGDLPPSLTNISSLVELNLGTNSLVGPIPSDLNRLVNLRLLDFSVNNLSGTLPPTIYNMSSLLHLSLSSNSLSGEISGNIGIRLPNLVRLHLCINRFTGTIPWSLHNLTNAKVIRLGHNRLHGYVPPGLGNLRELEEYYIGLNSIVGGLDFLESLTNSTRLSFLAFDSNLLEGTIPRSVGNLSKVLTDLYMGGNDIYGDIPPSIGELKSLRLLNLSYSSLSGEIPNEVGLLKELGVLELADNMFSGEIPDSLGNLQLLTKIDLSKNKLVGSIPGTFGNLRNLLSVDLSDNKLNGSLPVEFFDLPRLSILLNLSKNHLTGPLPVQIGSLDKVAVIDISDNELSGNIPVTIGGCNSLEKLLLARNMLSGPVPGTLRSVRGLEILDLSSNQLSGPIPSDLQDLRSLQLLNLSFNNLEGEIPRNGVFADPFKVHLVGNVNLFRKNSKNSLSLHSLYIIIAAVVVILSVCFAFGFRVCYVRKGKGRVKDLFEFSRSGQLPDQTISYDELRVATDNFDEKNLIGQGSFGFVYKGVVQGRASAIKVLDTSRAKSRGTFLAECAALRHLRHRNLIKLTTVCSSLDSKNEEFLALIFELMSNGNLDDWITGKRRRANGTRLSFLDRVRVVIGIASAVDYLHNECEVPIVHCDLKPSNVLLDADMTPKVGDFGLAKLLLDTDNKMSLGSTHSLRGSIGYIPPEYGYGEKASTAGDVYSFGIVLLELFTGRSPMNEAFGGGLSLKSWVKLHFPCDVDRVVDFDLIQETNTLVDCVIAVLGVGLSCAAESRYARVNIRDALRQLENVQEMMMLQTYHEKNKKKNQCEDEC